MGEILAIEAEMTRIKARLDAIEGFITPEAIAKSVSDRKAKARADAKAKADAKVKADADEAAKAKADAAAAAKASSR